MDTTQDGVRLNRFLRIREVENVTGLRKSAIYVYIAKGKFPRPVPLGEDRNSPVGWPDYEIAAWQAERLARRDGMRKRRQAA
jgi:prophage regulatory protein